jgi:hypothetical protein
MAALTPGPQKASSAKVFLKQRQHANRGTWNGSFSRMMMIQKEKIKKKTFNGKR